MTKPKTSKQRKALRRTAKPFAPATGYAALRWTAEKPAAAGWWWCRNEAVEHAEGWQAVVRIDEVNGQLTCSWMTAPGRAAWLAEADWSDVCWWAGPLPEPLESSNAQPLPNDKSSDESAVKKL